MSPRGGLTCRAQGLSHRPVGHPTHRRERRDYSENDVADLAAPQLARWPVIIIRGTSRWYWEDGFHP
jgi:hypothetical protein